MAVLIDMQAVTVRRPDRPLFDDLDLTIGDGDRIGVVGINGTGKSTLLRVAAGVDRPDAGTVRRGRGTRVGYLPQEPVLPAGTVAGAVPPGWEGEAALDRLGMGALGGMAVDALSGGQVKRVALAGVLADPAEVVVLDEPTNHLDVSAVAWLEGRLLGWRGAILLVTHDRHVLDRVTTRILELDRGRSHIHEGGYASYLEARAEREERAATAESTRRNLARRELAWLRRGAPARSRKPKARIESATAVVNGRPQAAARGSELGLALGTPRLGDKVIDAVDAGFSYPGRATPVLDHVDLALDPRERLGVVGPNGSGKSTLLDLLSGDKVPTSGRVEVGPTVATGYYRQGGDDLDPSARIRDLVAGPRPPGSPEDIALMERFWFTGELPFAPVGTLSGGERRRLELLLVLATRPNVLLLDEPTNDLDLDTLRILEDFFEDWPGALVVVSHDRTLLQRVTERLVAVGADGGVGAVAGGVDGWLASAGATGAARPSSSAGATSAPRPAAPSSGRPASGRRLRELEKAVGRLERRRDALTRELAGAGDHAEMARLGADLTSVQADLDAAEDDWLELAAGSAD